MIVKPTRNITCVSFNCKAVKRSVQHVRDLCTQADVIALQETWLMPHDLGFMNEIDKEFGCCAKSAVDTSVGVLRGRPFGGTALMWRSSLFTGAEIVKCDSDRIVAVRLLQGDRSLLVFSVYMPTDCEDNLPEFNQCFAHISAVIESSETECVLVLGDFNAHPGTLFGKELVDYCGEQSLHCIDLERLDPNTYTYVSEAHGTCRWLDHCIGTAAAASLVTDMHVMYDTLWSDHLPLGISCNLDFIRPKTLCNENVCMNGKYKWGHREPEQIDKYRKCCDEYLYNIKIKHNKTMNIECMDDKILCKNKYHFKYIDQLYCDIIKALQSASERSFDFKKCRKGQKIVGWNFHVRRCHVKAREHFLLWNMYGKPCSGYYYENMTASRREFKAALKYVQNNQEKIKMDVLARHRSSGNFTDFWKETKKLDYKNSLPISVEGEKDKKAIANLFRHHFNTVKDRNVISECEHGACQGSETHHVTVTPKQIETILRKMKRGKSPGHDGLSIEHMLYAGQHICDVLARLFSLCVRHCYLPEDLIRTLVVPITKNKTGDISSMANYRPISLATIVAKVLERVIQTHLSSLGHDDGQFGFRPQVSTDMAIFSLKQVVSYYKQRNTTVYACFLDLSRAFDTINHDLLWKKLRDPGAGVPAEVVDLLGYWYREQVSNVRWGSELSDSYRLPCGVRQGGLTSPDLFNTYVNELIVELSSTPVGLRLDDRYVNNLSYADDMVLLSPSIKGMRKLTEICERYAKGHDLIYNVKKTEMVIFRSGVGPHNVPDVYLNGQAVRIVDSFRYLGHIVTSSLKDDADVERQRRALCIVGNMIARKFFKASPDVKTTLFRSFCQTFYTCQLWTNYTMKTHDSIRVAYNNVFRHLMGLKRFCSASEMYTEARVDSFNAIQRKRIASFMSRVDVCDNVIIRSLAERLIQSDMYRRWVEISTQNQ